jgi:hypothetical protein
MLDMALRYVLILITQKYNMSFTMQEVGRNRVPYKGLNCLLMLTT